MSRYFPIPACDTLTLDDGSTLDVKRRITYGEQSDNFARMYSVSEATHKPPEVNLALVTLYLVDWHLVDDDATPPIKGRPADDVEATLRNLDALLFQEILSAVRAHEAAIEAERDAKKKRPSTTDAASSLLSPSVPDGTPTSSAV